MDIICPHQRPLVADRKYGLIFYTHGDDQTSCDLLNVFASEVNEVLTAIASARQFNSTVAVRAALMTSAFTRERLVDTMAQAVDHELAKLIMNAGKLCAKTQDYELLKQLLRTFGQTFLVNLELVTGKDYKWLLDDTKPVEERPMQSLFKSSVQQSYMDARQQRSTKEQQMKAALDDIKKRR